MVFPFLRTSCLGLAAIMFLGAGVVARWGFFAEAATEHGLGEPIAWTQGVSVWPSIALRVIAARVLLDSRCLARASMQSFEGPSEILRASS